MKILPLAASIITEIRSEGFRRFVILLAVCVASFFLLKRGIFIPAEEAKTFAVLLSVLMAAAGYRIKSTDFPRCSIILLRFVFGLFGLYLLAAAPTMSVDHLQPVEIFLVGPGRYIAAFFSLASFYRPSSGLILLTYVLWYKGILTDFFGFTITITDYMPLIEVAAFLVLSQMVTIALQRYQLIGMDAYDEKVLNTGEKLFLFGIAIHMANYFYSGMVKVLIGDHPLSWVLHNKTHTLIINSEALGQLPISFSYDLTAFIYAALGFLIVPTNFILLAGQLFSLFALLRVRWAIWTTLFYDLTHIVIFFTSGIFFYKWIILNLSIVLALETLKQRAITPALGLMLMGMIVCAPALFFVARLGWWDTSAINIESFSAVTKDGNIVRIPSNYFGGFSMTVAQNRMITAKENGFLPTSTYGVTYDQRSMEKAVSCTLPVQTAAEGNAIEMAFRNEDNRISAFIRSYHKWSLNHAGPDGRWLYDLYPHHIFSSPWEFPEFMALNLNDIVAYRYAIEASCLDMKDGKITRKILKEGYHDIPVTP